jgi:hypothetical protein
VEHGGAVVGGLGEHLPLSSPLCPSR